MCCKGLVMVVEVAMRLSGFYCVLMQLINSSVNICDL